MDTKQTKKALVVLAIGDKYFEEFNRTYRESHEKFAKKIGVDFIVINEFIDKDDGRHPSWQKLRMFDHPEISKYDRVLFLDSDIWITKHANDPFELCKDSPWGIAQNNPFELPYLTKNDVELYINCADPKKFDCVFNTGAFVIDKEYKWLLEKVYNSYSEQACHENGPLSYELLSDEHGVELPTEFNAIVVSYLDKFGRGLSTYLKLYREASFVHFAGGVMKSMPAYYIIKILDTDMYPITKFFIKILGHRIFDFITRPLLWLIRRTVAFYDHHIGKKWKKLSHSS